MKKFIPSILVLVLILSLMPFAASAVNTPNNNVPALRTNLSGMSTTTLSGANIDSSIFSSHELTVLHYFATWSADCVREIKLLQEANYAFGQEVAVLGLLHEDATSTPSTALALFDELNISYPAVHLDSVLTSLVSEYNYIPQTILVDSAGNVVNHFVGTFSDYSTLEAMIESFLPSDEVFYTVRFYDEITGELIKRQRVLQGGSALPPKPPKHLGYEFTGWDGNYTNVQHNEDVYARYNEVGPLPVLGDVDGDGSITFSDALLIARHTLGLAVSGFNSDVADINEDGGIDFNDAILVLRIALEIQRG